MYCLLIEINEVDFDLGVVWGSLAPFKVECFVWELLLGQILTRLELVKMGFNVNEVYNCGLCGASDEYMEHLFFNCKYAQAIWHKWCNIWELRIAFQMEDCGGGHELSGLNGLCRLKTSCRIQNVRSVARVKKRICQKDEWDAPPASIVKFNTDGTVKGGFGSTRVGGVLKDHSDNLLLKSSNSSGIVDPASAELLAIKKAISLFASSKLAGDMNMQVETDYNNVVA
ncbi:hypothetical protein V6N11_026371 [Hibiscus sabdariffa]|uniref:Reverse transcriptase zinc-binding domain-containing protein n=1 Tax=Hibiscus sabdariffa TaxID=183260 RepID=A0ABR2SVH3_9ROSI